MHCLLHPLKTRKKLNQICEKSEHCKLTQPLISRHMQQRIIVTKVGRISNLTSNNSVFEVDFELIIRIRINSTVGFDSKKIIDEQIKTFLITQTIIVLDTI